MNRDEIDKIKKRDAANHKAKKIALEKWQSCLRDDPTDDERVAVIKMLDGLAEDATPTAARLARARADGDRIGEDFCMALLDEEQQNNPPTC